MLSTPSIEPICEHFRHAVSRCRTDGHAEGLIAEAMLAAGLDAVRQAHGSRDLAQQLYVIAVHFAREADLLDGAIAEGGRGKPN